MTLEEENKRLKAELVLVLEDRARFPDKPDWIGNMLGAHIGNLKAKAEACEQTALSHMTRSQRLAAALREIDKIATTHKRGAAGLMQAVARRALAS